MKRFLLFCTLLPMSLALFAQVDSAESEEWDEGEIEWLRHNMNEEHVYGIRLGMSTSAMLGGELDNPRPLFGVNGSVYYRYRYTPRAAVQIEAGFSRRGSRFANSPTEYTSIRMYCIDVPLFWVRSLNRKGTSHALVGAQYSRMLEPDIYIGRASRPEEQTPKLKTDDLMLLAGAQFYAGFVGFQLVAKYGLVNINNGLIPTLNPPFKNKDIHHCTFEINFLF